VGKRGYTEDGIWRGIVCGRWTGRGSGQGGGVVEGDWNEMKRIKTKMEIEIDRNMGNNTYIHVRASLLSIVVV
jgi:hypothetical protein